MLETGETMNRTMPPIHIDREGQWRWEGRPMVHENILGHLKQHLERDTEGRWWVAVGATRVPVVVEDAPYLVEAISLEDRTLRLDDGTVESIAAPLELLSSRDHRLYARVKKDALALLSRTAHQLVWDRLEQHGDGLRLCGSPPLSVRIRDI